MQANKRLCLLLAGVLCLSLLCGCEAHTHVYEQTVIAPTCVSIGYTINVCDCGDVFYSDYRSETPHDFSDWETGTEADLVHTGEELSYCKNCGELQIRKTENLSALPKLFFSRGDDGNVDTLFFSGKELVFTCGAALNEEANSEKPDFTLSLYRKENLSAFLTDFGWGMQSTYRLRGHYVDPVKARDRAGKAFWTTLSGLQMGEDAESAPVAFPVQVYIGDEYLGMYDLCPDEQWEYRKEGERTAALYSVDGQNNFTGMPVFSLPSLGEEKAGFAFLYCTGESVDWAEESFTKFYSFVSESSDRVFKERLSRYTDTEMLIDFYLTSVVLNVMTGLEDRAVWYTGDGVHWLPTFAEMSCSAGITEKGTPCWHIYNLPPKDESGVIYKGSNLLWKRFVTLFREEIMAKYTLLRETIFSADILTGYYTRAVDESEAGLLDEELALYPDTPKKSNSQTIGEFFAQRLEALDPLFLILSDENPSE